MTSPSPFLGGGERDGGEGLPQRRGNAFAEGLKARDSTAWGEAPGPRFPENTERCKRETMPHPRPPPWAGPTALDHSSWSQPGAALPAFAPPPGYRMPGFQPSRAGDLQSPPVDHSCSTGLHDRDALDGGCKPPARGSATFRCRDLGTRTRHDAALESRATTEGSAASLTSDWKDSAQAGWFRWRDRRDALSYFGRRRADESLNGFRVLHSGLCL